MLQPVYEISAVDNGIDAARISITFALTKDDSTKRLIMELVFEVAEATHDILSIN